MKIKLILGLCLAALGLPAQTMTNSYSVTPGLLLPDNNANGYSTTFTVNLENSITDISVALDITGGFNGDLYTYLVSPTGQMAVLLNRVGRSGSSAYGYSNTGFDITLATGSTQGNVHNYQNLGANYNLDGQLTGTWTADGRNLDPRSSGSLFSGTSPTLGLDNYIGADPYGVWTFFIADLSPGGQSTLQGITLNIMTVPEPQTWVMLGGGMAVFCLCRSWRFRR